MAKAKTKTKVQPKTEPTPEQVELSKEELNARRDEITNYYSENIKHLKVQLEYETILKDIEKTRAERVQAQAFLAQAMAPPPTEEEQKAVRPTQEEFEAAAAGADYDADGVPPKRTLKRF